MTQWNITKTFVLVAVITGIAAIICQWFGGSNGALLGVVTALVLNVGTYWFGDRIVLLLSQARPINPQCSPRVVHIVDRLVLHAAMPRPRIYLLPDSSANAFALGRDPEHAVLVITESLLVLLSDDELEGVIAHELANIRNRDTLIGTFLAVMLGVLMMPAQITSGGWTCKANGDFAGVGKIGSGVVSFLLLLAMSPLAVLLVRMGLERSRESFCDAVAAEMCGKPLALANALLKLEKAALGVPYNESPETAHLFIINPLHRKGLFRWFDTRLPVAERLKLLGILEFQMTYLRSFAVDRGRGSDPFPPRRTRIARRFFRKLATCWESGDRDKIRESAQPGISYRGAPR